MLTGQNGILNRAQEAKEKTEKSQQEENEKLQGNENIINQYAENLPTGEGTTPYLPDATKFEKIKNTDLRTGLVIKEKTTGSEYVWVEVPKTDNVYPTAGTNITDFTTEEYTKIEADLHTYTDNYRNETSFSDVYCADSTEGWFTETGDTSYDIAKKKMLKSVYQNGGFWVGRYEAGIVENRTASGTATEIPLSKENLYPYTYVTRTQAKVLAEKVESGNYTSSLMFGVQWDLVLKYIETKFTEQNSSYDIKTKLTSNSTTIGNYCDSEITLNRGKFAQHSSLSNWYFYNSEEKTDSVSGSKRKAQSSNENTVLLTTGATEATNLQNIYDIAGNVWEWTLEKTSNGDSPCARRGGSYVNNGTNDVARYRNVSGILDSSDNLGFRVSIY